MNTPDCQRVYPVLDKVGVGGEGKPGVWWATIASMLYMDIRWVWSIRVEDRTNTH